MKSTQSKSTLIEFIAWPSAKWSQAWCEPYRGNKRESTGGCSPSVFEWHLIFDFNTWPLILHEVWCPQGKCKALNQEHLISALCASPMPSWRVVRFLFHWLQIFCWAAILRLYINIPRINLDRKKWFHISDLCSYQHIQYNIPTRLLKVDTANEFSLAGAQSKVIRIIKKKVKDQIGHEDLQLNKKGHCDWTMSAYLHSYVTFYLTSL